MGPDLQFFHVLLVRALKLSYCFVFNDNSNGSHLLII